MKLFRRLYLEIIIGICVLLLIVIYLLQSNTSETIIYDSPLPPKETPYKIPSLKLPLKYFLNDSILWGNIGDGEMNERTTWKSGAVEGSVSFPTTTIMLSSDVFSNMQEKIPKLKTALEILEESGIFRNSFEEEISEYGEWAKRFLPDYTITSLKEFDVDGDGTKEAIIGLCEGGNHCPHKVIIVKDRSIIFTTTAINGPEIIDTKTSNGFFLHWSPYLTDGSKWDTGLSTTPGYIKTRFVFEDGLFKPLYEQEVLYFEVENTK